MSDDRSSALITTESLAQKLDSPTLRVLDASWHMPAEKRNAQAEFMATHIPSAAFFDIDNVCDRQSPYPHMLPKAEDFAGAVGALGIGPDSEVVVYDSQGLFSAARVWWMFRVFGHDHVKVLSGGLPKWKAEGRKLESGKPPSRKSSFTARLRPELLKTCEQMEANLRSRRELVLDARSPARFDGREPEPRPGLRSGHIEGSENIFFKEVLTPAGELKPEKELRALLAARHIYPMQPISATCGSGVTACILALMLYTLGNRNVAVYDGAWAEWGSRTAA